MDYSNIKSKIPSQEYKDNFDKIFRKVKYNMWMPNGSSETKEFLNEEEAHKFFTLNHVAKYIKVN